jgi:hypothetical protein
MPPSIKADCSVADSTAILNTWLNGLPSGSSVQFPANGCFHIQGSLWLHNTAGLTINGNDSTILQTVPGPESVVQPIVYLTQDTQLVMKNLTIDGAYNGSNGGVNFEGDYGLLLEADRGVTLNHISVNNIQGNFIDLNAPNSGVTGSDTSLNSDIFVTHSTFHHCGYHGLTIESADGVAFSQDAFSGIGTDAMDFEYDVYSTTFDAQGNPKRRRRTTFASSTTPGAISGVIGSLPCRVSCPVSKSRTWCCRVTRSTPILRWSRSSGPIRTSRRASTGTSG